MDKQTGLDDAIDVAIGRTRGAQAKVKETLQPDELPEPVLVDRVVHRAEDLYVLADEASVEAEVTTESGRESSV
jgi:hypothetical protein